MRRNLSTKLVLAVLGAVILPFLGFAVFISSQIDTRLKENVVRQSLLGLAQDLGGEIDRMIEECNAELLLMAEEMLGDWAIDEHDRELELIAAGDEGISQPAWGVEPMIEWARSNEPGAPFSEASLWRRTQTTALDRHVSIRGVYDLILLVNLQGELVSCTSVDPRGRGLPDRTLELLFERDFTQESWFTEAQTGHSALVDHHRSPLLPELFEADPLAPGVDAADFYHIGFAFPVSRFLHPDEPAGVLFALVSWSHVQGLVDVSDIQAYFSGLVRDKEPSPYAWIWASDANTILGHKDRSLYNELVSGPRVDLMQMVEDVRRGPPSGLYREYTFRGKGKNAAYDRCRGPSDDPLEAGFGWVVGVGIDNEDIFAMADELRTLLYLSTAVVLLLVVFWTMVVARRMTRPILALQQHTRKVAQGDLEAKIELDTGDELSALAADFNYMIDELRENRAQLIKAEKDAAWREMARQIAHDIKNPLTPIKLSVDLLKRARLEKAPNFDEILDRSLHLVENQITNLREIATDFYEFTGGRKAKFEVFDLTEVMREVLHLNRAWAEEQGIEIFGEERLLDPAAPPAMVRAAPIKLHRVLANLVSNAFQAMPEGGRLSVRLTCSQSEVILELEDTGVGLSDEVRAHLFEPYFTTRSEGTGLGLAIAKRVVEECGGTISLEQAPARQDAEPSAARAASPDGGAQRGTLARITLPLHDERLGSAAESSADGP